MRSPANWRLLGGHAPPLGWWSASTWSGEKARRRCRCGAAVIARSSSWTRCERGHVRRPVPVAPAAAPPPPAAPVLPPRLVKLLADLRDLQVTLRRRPAPSHTFVTLTVEAFHAALVEYPAHVEAIRRALPVLAKRAEKLARATAA